MKGSFRKSFGIALTAGLLIFGIVFVPVPAEAVYYIKKKKEQTTAPAPIIMPAPTAPALATPMPSLQKKLPCTDQEREALRSLQTTVTDYDATGGNADKQAAQQKRLNELMAFLAAPGNVEKMMAISLKCAKAPVAATGAKKK